MNSFKSHARLTELSTKSQITLSPNITMTKNSTLQAKTRKQTTSKKTAATQNSPTEKNFITKNSTLKSQTRKKTTTKKTTTKKTTTNKITSKFPIEPDFPNWKDDFIGDDIHTLKIFAGFQTAFGTIFFLIWICLLVRYVLEFSSTEISSIIFSLIIGCIYVFPHFVCPITGFVSLNYKIRTTDDAKLSYNIFRTYAIMTTYNIILVSTKKNIFRVLIILY